MLFYLPHQETEVYTNSQTKSTKFRDKLSVRSSRVKQSKKLEPWGRDR